MKGPDKYYDFTPYKYKRSNRFKEYNGDHSIRGKKVRFRCKVDMMDIPPNEEVEVKCKLLNNFIEYNSRFDKISDIKVGYFSIPVEYKYKKVTHFREKAILEQFHLFHTFPKEWRDSQMIEITSSFSFKTPRDSLNDEEKCIEFIKDKVEEFIGDSEIYESDWLPL